MKYFAVKLKLPESVENASRKMLSQWTGELAENGYTLTGQTGLAATYRRQYWQWTVILLAIFFFPLGLLFLLIKNDATIALVVDSDDEGGGTILSVSGQAPRRIRKHFELLPESIAFSERRPPAPT